MCERILFLTGKLARAQLDRVLQSMPATCFDAVVHEMGISVAGLMTADMIRRRLDPPEDIARIIVPGRCSGNLDKLSHLYGLPVERGPEDLKDLPEYFGFERQKPDLSRYDINIFAEIVDAPHLTVAEILSRARYYQQVGADVVDIGCLPDQPFPHLSDAIECLHDHEIVVSVDSLNTDELIIAGKAGADYLLSLNADTLWIAEEVSSVPVLIPTVSGGMDSLLQAMDALDARGREYIADPILDPLLFGFTEALLRYRQLRSSRPDTEILMGIGNVTELTDSDTGGINAVLIAIASELGIRNILTTEVSPHARRAVAEVDSARRLMFSARESNTLPRGISDCMLSLHERKPFPHAREEIAEVAALVRDPSYRIQNSVEGIHVYNRDGLHSACDPFHFLPKLEFRGDVSHAFYMGAELARAQIAWQLGKRHVQDQELNWGCATTQQTPCGSSSDLPTALDKTGSRS